MGGYLGAILSLILIPAALWGSLGTLGQPTSPTLSSNPCCLTGCLGSLLLPLLHSQMAAGKWAAVEDAPFSSCAHYPWLLLSQPSQATPTSLLPSELSRQEAPGCMPDPPPPPPPRTSTKYTLCLMQTVKGHPIWVDKLPKSFPFQLLLSPYSLLQPGILMQGKNAQSYTAAFANSGGHTPSSPKNPLTPDGSPQFAYWLQFLKHPEREPVSTSCMHPLLSDFLDVSPSLNLLGQWFL